MDVGRIATTVEPSRTAFNSSDLTRVLSKCFLLVSTISIQSKSLAVRATFSGSGFVVSSSSLTFVKPKRYKSNFLKSVSSSCETFLATSSRNCDNSAVVILW